MRSSVQLATLIQSDAQWLHMPLTAICIPFQNSRKLSSVSILCRGSIYPIKLCMSASPSRTTTAASLKPK